MTLLAQRRGEVDDAEFRGHWDPVAGTAERRAEVTADSCAYPVTFEVYPLDADVSPQPLVAGVVEDQHRVVVPVDGARPWSPEEPNLYQVCIRSNMGCSAQFTVGFTDVTIGDDGVLCTNGHALRFRGVNRHEFHPTRGRAVTEQDTVADYITMLGHHINAVRTSHSPPASHAMDLADRMGLWVVLEGDVETHGFVRQGWRENPSNDPQWQQAILDRTARMWHRDKNHPCVVMLSLGNESNTGANLRMAAQWLRQHSRLPIHYEGDFQAEYTDVHSRMYATPTEWRKLASGQPHPAFSPDTVQTVAHQPLVLCEYAHAMGNGPGGLDDYERIYREFPRACGGFV